MPDQETKKDMVKPATVAALKPKRPDETVRGGMIVRPRGNGFEVVDAEGEPIDGKVVVMGPNGTLEVADA